MFIQYRNISLPCQSSNSPAFIQSPKNPQLLQRWRDNDGPVAEREGGRAVRAGMDLQLLIVCVICFFLDLA